MIQPAVKHITQAGSRIAGLHTGSNTLTFCPTAYFVWQGAKAAALGRHRLVSKLAGPLAGDMLDTWTQRAAKLKDNGWCAPLNSKQRRTSPLVSFVLVAHAVPMHFAGWLLSSGDLSLPSLRHYCMVQRTMRACMMHRGTFQCLNLCSKA